MSLIKITNTYSLSQPIGEQQRYIPYMSLVKITNTYSLNQPIGEQQRYILNMTLVKIGYRFWKERA